MSDYRSSGLDIGTEAIVNKLISEHGDDVLIDYLREQATKRALLARITNIAELIPDGGGEVESGLSNLPDRVLYVIWRYKKVLDQLLLQYSTDALISSIRQILLVREQAYKMELAKHAAQYRQALVTLETFGISLDGAPRIEAVIDAITPKLLAPVGRMVQPKIVLVPNCDDDVLIQSIDTHSAEYGIDSSWNGLRLESRHYKADKLDLFLSWEVWIVEGQQNIGMDVDLQTKGGRTWLDGPTQIRALIGKYKSQGLNVLSGTRLYLSLFMKGLSEKKPIDSKSATVLNPRAVIKKQHTWVGMGFLADNRLYLDGSSEYHVRDNIRLRSALKIKV